MRPPFVAATSPVPLAPWRPRVFVMFLMTAATLGLLTGAVVVSADIRVGVGLPTGITVERSRLAADRWHLWTGWERETLPTTLLGVAGFGPNPDRAEGEDAIRNYFRLTSQIRALDSGSPAAAQLTQERAQYENTAERYVAGLVDDAVGAAGLRRSLPLFGGASITWPPVSFELTTPPRILIRSPRDRIARAGDTLLKNDLTAAEMTRIERETDTPGLVSIVEPIGGLAAYPAVISGDRSFDGWLETTAHEWVHHYLAFFPLGARWGRGGDGVTLNETTANIAGRELANLMRALHPLKLPAGEDGAAPPRTCEAEPIDFAKEMRALRLEVDALLAAGKVPEAEALMEQRRLYFADHCVTIRKLNQAYFAFHGSYADTPASSDPIGPKVERVWTLTKAVGPFLAVMRGVESVDGLDAAIAALERAPAR
ncbi:MAG: hypothetical protein ACKVT1_10120 [Dehalococcoidia bacterium]